MIVAISGSLREARSTAPPFVQSPRWLHRARSPSLPPISTRTASFAIRESRTSCGVLSRRWLRAPAIAQMSLSRR